MQINPAWSVALRRLADVHARAGELTEERAILEQAVARAPLDCANHGCLADVLWRLGEKDAALERLRHSVLLEPGYDWGWNALSSWTAQLEQPEIAVAFARDLTVRRPGEARSWLRLARMLSEPEDLDERLAALDRALELNPRLHDAYDLKAELLVQEGRLDEALAVCRPTAWGEDVPITIRGRAAWIECQRGDLAEAVAQMRAVLAEDPNYYWGWSNVAAWARDTGTAAEYLEAAEHMVRLDPHGVVPLGYRGDARLRNDDRTGAKADFRRALELAPEYPFAAQALFDEHFEDGEYEEAGWALEALKKHNDGELVLAREVRWAAHHEDLPTARNHFRRLCVTVCDDTWPLDTATAVMRETGWAGEAELVLGQALAQPEVHPHAATLWVRLSAARQDWSCGDRLDALLERGEVGKRALREYLSEAGKAKRGRLVRRCVERFEKQLRDDTLGWGLVGYALTTVEDFRRAAAWLADWADRSDAQPWMLMNLVIALRALKRDAEANAVSRHAGTLPADGTSRFHVLWLALDEALAGQTAAAAQLVDGLDAASCDATHQFLHALVTALLDVQRSAGAERGRAFHRARRHLRQTARQCGPVIEDRRAVGNIYRRCVARLAQDGGGLVARLWSWWRRLDPVLPPNSNTAG